MATPLLKTPNLLGGEEFEDTVPPKTRVTTKRGERTPPPIRTNLLPEFEEVDNTTGNMITNQNQNQPNVPKTKRYLTTTFKPLKLSDNHDPLPKKYHEWLPKFKGNVDQVLKPM